MSSRYPLSDRAFLCRAGAVATGFIAPLAFTRSVWAQGKADVIFSGGTIITMDTATPRAGACAVLRPGRLGNGSWAARVAPELALRGVTIDAAYQCAVFVRYSLLAVVMIKATSLTFQAG